MTTQTCNDMNNTPHGRLILFPVPISDNMPLMWLPSINASFLNNCRTFIVEELRTARRFLRLAHYEHSIDETTFVVLNEHTADADISSCLDAAMNGQDVGLLSEAGLPCVADPGAKAVRLAHSMGIEVVPLVGPSSLMMALMSSGMNGQSFAFVGYLPVKEPMRSSAIRQCEQNALRHSQTQIIIEAPYRNNQLLEALCATCHGSTLIGVACDLTLPTQYIKTLTVAQWRKMHAEINLNKRNTVFTIGC